MRETPATTQASSPARSPTRKQNGFEEVVIPEVPEQNIFAKLLVTPITIISFLLSLFIIDAHNHSLRQHSHSSSSLSQQPPVTTFAKLKSWLHHLVFKPTSFSQVNSASPYAYVKSPGSERIGVVGEQEFGVKDVRQKNGKTGDEHWYWRTKQKKMIKAEFADAFKIRKWVVGFLGVACAGMGVLGWFLMGWVGGVLNAVLVGGRGENMLARDW